MILRTHFDNWMTACEEMNRSNLFFSFPMKLNILADFQDSDLKEMMDLRIKYSGLGSYDDPIEVNRFTFVNYVLRIILSFKTILRVIVVLSLGPQQP